MKFTLKICAAIAIVFLSAILFHHFHRQKLLTPRQESMIEGRLQPPREPVIAYWQKGNIFQDCFKESFEIMFLIFKNGDFYSVSTHHANFILITPWDLKDYLDKEGKRINDIILIVHNHLINKNPSSGDGDIYFLRKLRDFGFNGSFGIYTHASGMIFPYERK